MTKLSNQIHKEWREVTWFYLTKQDPTAAANGTLGAIFQVCAETLKAHQRNKCLKRNPLSLLKRPDSKCGTGAHPLVSGHYPRASVAQRSKSWSAVFRLPLGEFSRPFLVLLQRNVLGRDAWCLFHQAFRDRICCVRDPNFGILVLFASVFQDTVDAIHTMALRIEKNNYGIVHTQVDKMGVIEEKFIEYHEATLNGTVTMNDIRHFYEDALQTLRNQIFSLSRGEENEDPHWRPLVAMELLLQVRNSLGTEHYLGQKFFYGDEFYETDYNTFIGKIYVTEKGIDMAAEYHRTIKSQYTVKYEYNYDLQFAIEKLTNEIVGFPEHRLQPHDLNKALRWRDNVTTYALVLEEIELAVADDIEEIIANEKQTRAAEVPLDQQLVPIDSDK